MEAQLGAFEYIDHTADLGVRVTAKDLDDLFATAARALYRAIGELVVRNEPARDVAFLTKSSDLEEALHDALAEFLFLFETRGRMVDDIRATHEPGGAMRVAGSARSIDETLTVYEREVKAVTYHEINVTRTDAGFTAFFLLDI